MRVVSNNKAVELLQEKRAYLIQIKKQNDSIKNKMPLDIEKWRKEGLDEELIAGRCCRHFGEPMYYDKKLHDDINKLFKILKFKTMLGNTDARKLWKNHENEDGYITMTPEEIVDPIEDYDEREDTKKALYSAFYYYDIEYKDEKETEWRFVKEKTNVAE